MLITGFFGYFTTLLGSRPGTAEPLGRAATRFLLNFERKYGRNHPDFYPNSYMAAVREAESNLRFLLVYLECSDHEDTDSFNRNVICSPEFMQFVRDNNLICWAGNVSHPESFQVHQVLQAFSFPFMALVGKYNNKITVLSRIDGVITTENLIAKLTQQIQIYGQALRAQQQEQEERQRARQLRQQQESEYMASLLADQEKERKAQEEKEAAERKQREEAEAEERRQHQIREEQLARERKAQMLPPEPDANEKEGVTTIAYRLLDGTKGKRRFRDTDTVQILYDFLETKVPCKILVRAGFPTKSLTDKSLTLKEANLLMGNVHVEAADDN